MQIVKLYTRKRCPLCEQAELVIEMVQEESLFQYEAIDIETSDDLTERFGLMIPVIEVDGEILQYGQVDYVTLSEKLSWESDK
ncbi:glutaredoxin family protein [Cytobacillus sp. FSL W7-1323]|uniref:glutaredoxin family protein n=1 Tax=Cytobacillus TaxID=2675230 RepID=UPI002AFE8E36|nr:MULTISPECIES: glutaredoxin family protein [Cytobacillus]MEA1855433.1 glutaredoxin family protein [Cytobacillus sp. OWB-43]MED1605514.1 glutaredoxin family protein [Cytobacillus kochii]